MKNPFMRYLLFKKYKIHLFLFGMIMIPLGSLLAVVSTSSDDPNPYLLIFPIIGLLIVGIILPTISIAPLWVKILGVAVVVFFIYAFLYGICRASGVLLPNLFGIFNTECPKC